jgi:hypothetical protein
VAGRAADLIGRVGLTDAAERRVATYSGGMRRRLDLAMALIHSPPVLFLDEPTTGLDPVSRLTLWEEVRRLKSEGTTVFLTTQYLEEADVLADRVGIISAGLLVAEGTPEALKAQVGSPHLDIALEPASIPPPPGRSSRASARCAPRRRAPSRSPCRAAPRTSPRWSGARRRRDHGRVDRPRAADARRRVRGEDRTAARGRGRVGGPAGHGGRRVIRPTVALARRALRNALRRPQFLAPLVLFPTLFLAVNVGGLNRTPRCPASRRSTASWTSSSPRR